MTFLLNLFLFLLVVCEVVFLIGVITIVYHVVKSLIRPKVYKNKYWR